MREGATATARHLRGHRLAGVTGDCAGERMAATLEILQL